MSSGASSPRGYLATTLAAIALVVLGSTTYGQESSTDGVSTTASQIANQTTTAGVEEIGEQASAVEELRLEAVPLDGVSARGAALLLSGLTGGEVRGATTWTVADGPSAAADAMVLFVVEVDGGSLLAGSAGERIRLELYGYLVDDAGAVVRHFAEGVVVDAAAHVAAVAGGGLKFIGTIEVPSGLYSFRVVVRNRQTGEFFLSRQDIQIPQRDAVEPFLLPPLIADRSPNWAVTLQHGLDVATTERLFPGISAWPSARPVWDSTQPLDMVVGCPGATERYGASVRLLDAAGFTVGERSVALGERILSTGLADYYRVTVPPPDLPAGAYRLVIELADVDSGQSVTYSMNLDVHRGGASTSWAMLDVQGEAPATHRPTASERLKKSEIRKREVVSGYANALGLLAAGNAVAGRQALADVEVRVTATRSPQRIKHLQAVEIRKALQLAEKDPNTILAVTLFHRDMYRWYAARRRTALASHSWQVVTGVMDQVARVQDGLPMDGFREAVLLDQASDLAREGDIAGARRLLEELVGIAPQNPQARLGLAALCERTGDPATAVENLQALLEHSPDHAEARLRLAVNQLRVGDRRTAEGHLRTLLAGQAPLWIRTLAYQELGRSLVDRGRVGEGERLLHSALDEIPRNQRLRLLYAYALDLQQRPWDATRVIEELDSLGGQYTTSPRLLYAQWPDLELERARDILTRAQNLGLRALREALE